MMVADQPPAVTLAVSENEANYAFGGFAISGVSADVKRVQREADAIGWHGTRSDDDAGMSTLILQLPPGRIQQGSVDFMNRILSGEFGKVHLQIIAEPPGKPPF